MLKAELRLQRRKKKNIFLLHDSCLSVLSLSLSVVKAGSDATWLILAQKEEEVDCSFRPFALDHRLKVFILSWMAPLST